MYTLKNIYFGHVFPFIIFLSFRFQKMSFTYSHISNYPNENLQPKSYSQQYQDSSVQ